MAATPPSSVSLFLGLLDCFLCLFPARFLAFWKRRIIRNFSRKLKNRLKWAKHKKPSVAFGCICPGALFPVLGRAFILSTAAALHQNKCNRIGLHTLEGVKLRATKKGLHTTWGMQTLDENADAQRYLFQGDAFLWHRP